MSLEFVSRAEPYDAAPIGLSALQIGPAAVARMRRFGCDFANSDWPPHGMPREDVIAARGMGRDWLEAMVLAGHVPHLEGICIAIHGVYEFTAREVRRSLASKADGDAIGWAVDTAQHLELLARETAEFAAELRRLASRI